MTLFIDLKFRVWDRHFQKFVENFSISPNGKISVPYLNQRDIQQWNEKGLFVLQQFTNLKDKLGKDIYDGDIVRLCGEAIVFKNQRIKEVKYIKNSFQPENICFPREIEVIGNIFENPDLLKN